jgi:hypothetical protein
LASIEKTTLGFLRVELSYFWSPLQCQ